MKMNKTKKKLPLVLRLLLGVVAIIIGAMIGITIGSGGTSTTKKPNTIEAEANAYSDANTTEEAEQDETVIIDSDTITVEFLGFEDHPELDMFIVRLRVKNKIEQPIWVYMDKASVNDEMMQMVMTGTPLYIDPEKRGSNGFIFYYKQTSIEKFDDVNTVSFKLRVANQDTMMEIWTSPEVTLTK